MALSRATAAQVLAAHNDRESILPYIEVFKTLIRCTHLHLTQIATYHNKLTVHERELLCPAVCMLQTQASRQHLLVT